MTSAHNTPSASGEAASARGKLHSGMLLGANLVGVGALWSLSSYGYYALVSVLGLDSGYNEAPLLFTAYYLAWTFVGLLVFRHVLMNGNSGRRRIWTHAVALIPMLAAFSAFVVFILPVLPPVSVWRAPNDPPEFMFATGWYYLPKSADILFQQVLVASMIFTATRLEMRIGKIAIGIGLAFGCFHLLLALDGFSTLYVARFTVAGTLFGLAAPYLYLRVRHGFRWAYGLHWSFYALDATLTHFSLAVPPWAIA